MAKGVHSKRRKKNQAIKRKILDEKLWRPRLQETSNRLFKRTFGKGDDSVTTRKKNAFRYPDNVEAEFPQFEKASYIDKRAKNAKTEYLIRDIGIKKKNQIKNLHIATLNTALKDAENRALGIENEDDVIEMGDIDDMDNFQADHGNDVDDLDMNKFSLNERAKKRGNKIIKKKEMGMEVDTEETGKKVTNVRRNHKKHIKKKSYYIVNY